MNPYAFKNMMIPYPISSNLGNGTREMEFTYLEEMYPEKIKQYQKKVNEEVDRIDYRGSVIYDEYPDRLILYRMAVRIKEEIEITCETKEKKEGGPCELIELVQILLYQEIAKRKRNQKQSFWIKTPDWEG